ncbi:MAG TPA: hypothetical protein VM204_02190 [Gaiellaceae bacterium]|nr:hypothetical protein [Gaiellaceae bacterium]
MADTPGADDEGSDLVDRLSDAPSLDELVALLSDDRLEEAVGSVDDELSDGELDAVWARALSFSGDERGRALGLLGSLATLSAAFTLCRPPFLVEAKRRSIARIDGARETLHALLDDASPETRAGAALLLARAGDVTPSLEALLRRARDERAGGARAGCWLAAALAARRCDALAASHEGGARREALAVVGPPRGEGLEGIVAAAARALAANEVEIGSIGLLEAGVCDAQPMPMPYGFLTGIATPEATDELVGELLLHVDLPRDEQRFVEAFARMAPALAPEVTLCVAFGALDGEPDGRGASPGDRAPRPPPAEPSALMRAALEHVRQPLPPWLRSLG